MPNFKIQKFSKSPKLKSKFLAKTISICLIENIQSFNAR